MRVLVTGASGFLGQRLLAQLKVDGHEVWALTRRGDPVLGSSATVVGDLLRSVPDLRSAAPEAIVHLAGESIGDRRWSASRLIQIRESRVRGSHNLAEALSQLGTPPRVAVSASAIGLYGDRGDEVLTETSARGEGFLAEVCEAWEGETLKLLPRGRCVALRFGAILGRGGGALPRLCLPFRLLMGGPLGSGRQWFSWIHRDDACGLIRFALEREVFCGAVNAVAPEAVQNRDLARCVGRILHRPSFVPTPAPLLALAVGRGLARELLLASQHVVAARAAGFGYAFAFPGLEAALSEALES